MKKHTKFLEFNKTLILFLSENGQTYVAIKPICTALNIAYAAQLRKLNKHPILAPALSLRTMQAPNDQGREMTCIPEKYVYGWIFSINSSNPELIKYQKSCYEILFNHFHGQIGGRRDLLMERNDLDTAILIKEELLKESFEEYNRLQALKKERAKLTRQLNGLDNNVIIQTQISFSDN